VPEYFNKTYTIIMVEKLRRRFQILWSPATKDHSDKARRVAHF